MASELEVAITTSFSTVLLSILVVSMKEVTGGTYEFLIDYLKNYSVWSLRVPEGSSGLRARIRYGVKTVAGRVKKLRATVTTDADLKDLSSILLNDSRFL
jgi:hypothetical protein